MLLGLKHTKHGVHKVYQNLKYDQQTLGQVKHGGHISYILSKLANIGNPFPHDLWVILQQWLYIALKGKDNAHETYLNVNKIRRNVSKRLVLGI